MLKNKALAKQTSTILVSLFSILFLSYGSGFKIPSYLMALLGGLLLLSTKWNGQKINKAYISLTIVFILYFLISVVYMFYHGESGGFTDKPAKTALSLLVLFFVTKFKPDKKLILFSIGIGAIVAAISAHSQIALDLTQRAFSYKISPGFHSIQSGDIAMSLGVFSFISGIYFIKQHPEKNLFWLFFLIAALSGTSASILSHSRGGWWLAPILISIIYMINKKHFNLKHNLSLALGVIALCFSHGDILKNRLETTAKNITKAQHEEHYSSAGIRLQLWTFSLKAAAESPFSGYNKFSRQELMNKYIIENRVSDVIRGIDRAHNQFLEELITKGFIGLLVYCSLLALPLWLYIKNFNSSDMLSQTYALLGISHVLLTASYSLTQHFFTFSSGAIFYAVYCVVFLCLSLPKQKEDYESIELKPLFNHNLKVYQQRTDP